MALIQCPECSKQISDKATACPQCGNPMGHATADTVPAAIAAAPVEKKSGCLKWVLIVPAVLVLAFTVNILIKTATATPAERAALERQIANERMCDEMMADSALGRDRAMTRQMCDRLLKRK